jgi:ubiquinone/menaquinone biosynthesis C-methylase UbiE
MSSLREKRPQQHGEIGSVPSHLDEVRRIKEVYAQYDRSPAVLRRRDTRRPGNLWIEREREKACLALLRAHLPKPLEQCRILDLGCGHGELLHRFNVLGVPGENLVGVDLLPDRIETAARTYPNITFSQANAEKLRMPDGCFDVVICFALFSSILDQEMARNVAREAMRVTADQGCIVWWDLRLGNPMNPHVRGMGKGRIQQLFPGAHLQVRTLTLLPPVARRLGPFTSILYPILAKLPLRSHLVGLISRKKRAS